MYIWVGIDVDRQLSRVRERAEAIETESGFGTSCYTLPMHISLKMSFCVSEDTAGTVIEELERYFAAQRPFTVRVRGLENEGPIVWIRMERSAELDALHDELNDMLLSRYGVALHEYDTDYKYHTTLFMDGDGRKLREACERMRNLQLPETLMASRFVIGTSESGALGTYSVLKTVCV